MLAVFTFPKQAWAILMQIQPTDILTTIASVENYTKERVKCYNVEEIFQMFVLPEEYQEKILQTDQKLAKFVKVGQIKSVTEMIRFVDFYWSEIPTLFLFLLKTAVYRAV